MVRLEPEQKAEGRLDRQIAIYPCPFGRKFIVTIEPRSIAWPSKDFRSFADASARAQALHDQHGWPVIDKTGGQAAGEMLA